MRIVLNGQVKEVQATDVAMLLRELELPQAGVALAQNGRVVRQADHPATRLHEDDVIELIHAVQGG
jgi:sulfur carrier protein